MRIGEWDLYFPSKSRKDSIVEAIRPIRGTYDHNPGSLLDAIPLGKECSHNVCGNHVGLRRATLPESSVTFVYEDNRRPIASRVIPYLPDSSDTGSDVLFFDVSQGELLEVAVQGIRHCATN